MGLKEEMYGSRVYNKTDLVSDETDKKSERHLFMSKERVKIKQKKEF